MLSEDKVCRIEIVTQGILSDIYLHAYYYMYLLHHIVRDLTKNDKYCISSNNSLGRLIFFFFSHQKGAIIQGGPESSLISDVVNGELQAIREKVKFTNIAIKKM